MHSGECKMSKFNLYKEQAKPIDGDAFCWKCNYPNTVFNCRKCGRSFHGLCLTTAEQKTLNPVNWSCSVCVELEEAENSVNIEELRLLPIIMKRVLSNKTFEVLRKPDFGENAVLNEVNLMMIKANIKMYKSLAEFRVDIEWINHKCWVKFNEENNEKAKAASLLVVYVKHEITTLLNCWECYANANNHPKNWFTMVCTNLHIIVWAKNESDGGLKLVYWPAKVLSVDGNSVNVQFFGDHTCGTTNTCYMYSNSNPTQGSSIFAYKAALNEAAAYIKNIRNRYGSFVMAPPRTVFHPAQINSHFNDMVPGFGKDLVININSSESETEYEFEGFEGLEDFEIGPPIEDNNPNHSKNISNSEPIDKNFNQNTLEALNESDVRTCEKRQSLKRYRPNNGTNSVENRVNSGSTSSDSDIIQMTPNRRRNSENTASVTSAFNDNMHQSNVKSADDYEKVLEKLKEKEYECESVKKRMLYSENYARKLLEKVEQFEKFHKDSDTQTNTLTNLGNQISSARTKLSEMINENDEMIATKNNQRNPDVSDLLKIIDEKDEIIKAKDGERIEAVFKAQEQCKMKCSAAKANYCAACGTARSTGIFVCNMECQRRLCEKNRKLKFKTGNKTDK